MSAPRILVVDDDPDSCLLTASLLRDDGHEVDTADGGLSALKLFGEESHDLVILDYRMPDMDGMDVLETMKSQWADVSTVFFTAYATIDMVEAALAAGAKRVIPKDSDNTELLKIVSELLKPVGDV